MLVVGVDVGGTFTDVVAFDGLHVRAAKVLTRVTRPWVSVREGVEKAAKLGAVDRIVHATTLGTNMLLGQVGLERPRVVLVTSRGFRDAVEIGRQARPEPYNMFFSKPEPLVPRRLRFEVSTRLYRDGGGGEVVEQEVKRIALKACSSDTVFVVALINCFVDGGSAERRIAELLRRYCPEALDVVTSCDVDPRPGEYERTSTAVIEGMLRPLFRRYMSELERELRSRGYRGDILVMQSSGGVAPLSLAAEHPVFFIESGPAAGVIAAAVYARSRGDELVVAFDMGGTTAKASLVVKGEPLLLDYFEVGGRFHAGRLVRGSGYPLRVPHVDLVEVSAGGGTIVWVDRGGSLRVGPLSAGSEPGPACYGKGGREPTLTDAHAVLGRLPARLAGGLLELDFEAARRSLERVGARIGLEDWVVAAEALRLANVEMARALRLVTVERGVDPSRVTLYAFGGAGPLHAAELAEELGIERVYIPPLAGVFSALGLILAPLRTTRMLGVHGALSKGLRRVEDALRFEAARLAERLGCKGSWRAWVDLSIGFRGQGGGVALRVDAESGLEERGVVERFLSAYRRLYGYLPPEPRPEPVILSASLSVECVEPKRLPRGVPGGFEVGSRRVYMLASGWVEARVYRGLPGKLRGPAVVELETTTVIVPEGWRGERTAEDGLLLVRE